MIPKLIKIPIIIFCILLLDISISCRKIERKFQWDKLTTQIINNVSSQAQIISSSDSVSNKSFGIRLSFSEISYTANTTLFLNSCYALKLPELWTNIDSVYFVKIITQKDFNDVYKSGDDISPLFRFKITEPNKSPQVDIQNLVNINGLVNYMNSPLQSWLYDYDIFLITNFIYKNSHSFIIEIGLSGNRILSDTTQSVIIY